MFSEVIKNVLEFDTFSLPLRLCTPGLKTTVILGVKRVLKLVMNSLRVRHDEAQTSVELAIIIIEFHTSYLTYKV